MEPSARLWAAWERVWSLIPEEDRALVTGGLRALPQPEIPNPSNYPTPCGAADLNDYDLDGDGRAVLIADCLPCVHSNYIEQVIMHEIGHIWAWVVFQDTGEQLADRYVSDHWPRDWQLAWIPMTQPRAAVVLEAMYGQPVRVAGCGGVIRGATL